jgi:hypothetical protein
MEVTKQKDESKRQYLQRILKTGSRNAMLLKCADRISNLTDLHRDTHSDQTITDYLDQTEEFVIPMAMIVNPNMVIELTDLVTKRRALLKFMEDQKIRG